jgi:hypothetical protein
MYCGWKFYNLPIEKLAYHFNQKKQVNGIEVHFQINNLSYLEMKEEYDKIITSLESSPKTNHQYPLKMIYQTNKDSIFKWGYSSCDGYCGTEVYHNEELEREIVAFMTGRAELKTVFKDKYNKITLTLGCENSTRTNEYLGMRVIHSYYPKIILKIEPKD